MTDTRERILDVAQELLRTRSYRGVSYQEIADRIGIRKASLFHHFRSKDELIAEVIRRSRSRAEEWHRTLPTDRPAENLRRFLRELGGPPGAGSGICIGGACVPAWDEVGEAVHAEVLALWRSQEEWVRRVVASGRERGAFRTDQPLETQLELMLSTVQGALMVARARGDRDVYMRTVDALVEHLRG